MAWFYWHVYPYIWNFFVFTFFVNLTAVAPALFQKRYRRTAGKIMYLSSYVFGVECWVASLGVCYALGGWTLILIGILLLGVGTVPLAILSALFTAHWVIMGKTIAILILAVWSRELGRYHGQPPIWQSLQGDLPDLPSSPLGKPPGDRPGNT